jgi:hypothetical protein
MELESRVGPEQVGVPTAPASALTVDLMLSRTLSTPTTARLVCRYYSNRGCDLID